MRNVSVIIPNYNGKKLLEENLPKAFEAAKYYQENQGGVIEVIIVDDGSSDGSTKAIEKSIKSITGIKSRLLVNERNLGFSSTVNRGVKEAKGEILVLLNTDVLPDKDFLVPLIEHFQDANVFAVGCMDKSIENGKVVLRGRGIGSWQRGFLVHARGEIDKTSTLWVSGGSGAFRKSAWQRLGGFNDLYSPFYWEDIDLSYRALKSGYTLLFEPKSVVTHKHEEGAIKKYYTTMQVKTVSFRNQFIFVWENATDFDLQLLHMLWLPYHFLKALMRFDFPFFLGFFQAFLLLPKVIQSSFKAQKLFVKSDKETMKNF